MKIVKTIVFSLFALMFIVFGLNKFIPFIPMPEMKDEMKPIMEAMMTLKWITPLAGFAEVLAGILILIPKTRALGAIIIFPVMVGIVCHHVALSPSDLMMPLVLLVINLWMIADNWKKYTPMIA